MTPPDLEVTSVGLAPHIPVPAPFSLDGRIALVTGGTRGIGRAMAWAMAGAGAHVVLGARDKGLLQTSAQALQAAGHSASIIGFDVADSEAVRRGIEQIHQEFGRIDILVGNAGQSLRKPLVDFSDADIDHLLRVNLGSALRLAQAVTPGMRAAGYGRMLFTGSMLGHVARANNALYSATKAGLAGLVRALAVELGPAGITCNAVAPGLVATEMTAALVQDAATTSFVRSRTPLGRWGSPEDVAHAALFLVSPASSFITGQVLLVDGGMSIAA